MKAITLWQPWASWIAWGLKTIETRTHKRFASLLGQRIAIHAALRFDVTAWMEAGNYIEAMIEEGGEGASPEFVRQASQADRARRECLPSFLPMGRIVATAMVQGLRRLTDADSPAALCDCSDGDRWGLLLTDVRQVMPTTPFGRRRPGGRGIFEVEEEESSEFGVQSSEKPTERNE